MCRVICIQSCGMLFDRARTVGKSQCVCVELSVYNQVDCCLLELEQLARSQCVCVELSVYNHVDCCLLELEQ
jgi:hypothetical protein